MVEVVVHCKQCGAGIPLEAEQKELLIQGTAIAARCRWCNAEGVFEPRDRWFFGPAAEIEEALQRKPETR